MREMKDSGIKWIGEIPREWSVGKIKKYYKLQTGFTPDTKNPLYYDDENGYDWVNISDLNGSNTIVSTKKKISQSYIDTYSPQIIPKGSLLYSFKLSVGQTAFAGKDLYSNEAIASFLNVGNVNLHFLRYSSILIVENAQTNIYSAKILNQDLINNAYVTFPPLPEQRRIADFLDRKCAEIDAVIEKTKAAVEEYKKLKQSVITEAVTKGVRGPRPMKPSGVEWIGDVPKGWEADKVKHLFTNGKGLSITKENLVETGLPVISYGQIHSKNNSGTEITDDLLRYVDFQYQTDFPQCEVFQYDFVFADTSEDYDGCGNCAYKQDSSILFGGYHTIILHSNSKKDNKYFAYLFKTNSWRKQLREVATGVKLFTIAQKTLMNSSVIIPPESEQQEISDYLDRKCAGIDNILDKKQQFIKELEAYKKSLIYEYVTGKKEVKS